MLDRQSDWLTDWVVVDSDASAQGGEGNDRKHLWTSERGTYEHCCGWPGAWNWLRMTMTVTMTAMTLNGTRSLGQQKSSGCNKKHSSPYQWYVIESTSFIPYAITTNNGRDTRWRWCCRCMVGDKSSCCRNGGCKKLGWECNGIGEQRSAVVSYKMVNPRQTYHSGTECSGRVRIIGFICEAHVREDNNFEKHFIGSAIDRSSDV